MITGVTSHVTPGRQCSPRHLRRRHDVLRNSSCGLDAAPMADAGAQIVLHPPVLVSQAGRAFRAELPRYCQAVREIAVDSGAVLVDHEAHWLARFADEDPIA